MKITRAESKLHDQACDILTKNKLTDEEKEFVFKNYNPMANHNVGKAGIFFTPLWIAEAFSVYAAAGEGTKVIDLGAGIGVLTYKGLEHDRSHSAKLRVCVEIEQEFADIGKKLVPEAEWRCGDVLDKRFVQSLVEEFGEFTFAVSNPPYGTLNQNGRDWLLTKGGLQWMFMEVAIRICNSGGMFLLPEVDCDYNVSQRRYFDNPRSQKTLAPNFPGVHLLTEPDILEPEEGSDQGWQGANPTTRIANLDVNDCAFYLPYGLEKRQVQPSLF